MKYSTFLPMTRVLLAPRNLLIYWSQREPTFSKVQRAMESYLDNNSQNLLMKSFFLAFLSVLMGGISEYFDFTFTFFILLFFLKAKFLYLPLLLFNSSFILDTIILLNYPSFFSLYFNHSRLGYFIYISFFLSKTIKMS